MAGLVNIAVPFVEFLYPGTDDININTKQNIQSTTWPTWYTFYIPIRCVFTFIDMIKYEHLCAAFACRICCYRKRKRRRKTCSNRRVEDSIIYTDSKKRSKIKQKSFSVGSISSLEHTLVSIESVDSLFDNLIADDFRIELSALTAFEKIAAGACGQVYKAFYFDTQVAVKELFSPQLEPLDLVGS